MRPVAGSLATVSIVAKGLVKPRSCERLSALMVSGTSTPRRPVMRQAIVAALPVAAPES